MRGQVFFFQVSKIHQNLFYRWGIFMQAIFLQGAEHLDGNVPILILQNIASADVFLLLTTQSFIHDRIEQSWKQIQTLVFYFDFIKREKIVVIGNRKRNLHIHIIIIQLKLGVDVIIKMSRRFWVLKNKNGFLRKPPFKAFALGDFVV